MKAVVFLKNVSKSYFSKLVVKLAHVLFHFSWLWVARGKLPEEPETDIWRGF